MPTLTILPAKPEERNLVANLLQLYLHDFSEIEALETNEDGLFPYQGFDAFWMEPHQHVFLAHFENKVVGFSFVKRGFYNDKNESYDAQLMDMVEFFVLRRYRRKRIGWGMALHCFQAFSGMWQVRTEDANAGAVKFWEQAIAEFSNNKFEVFRPKDFPGTTFYFESP